MVKCKEERNFWVPPGIGEQLLRAVVYMASVFGTTGTENHLMGECTEEYDDAYR